MPIDFHCKGCGKHYRVRDELAGRVAECKNCGQKMTVPKPDAPPSSQPAPPGPIGFADEEAPPPQAHRAAPQRPAPPPPSYEPEPETQDEYQEDQSSSYGDYDQDSGEIGVGAEPDDGPPSLRDVDVKDDAPEPARERRVRNTPILPDIAGETIIPLAGVALGLGGGAFVAGRAALNSSNPIVAFALLGVAIALFFFVMVPLTIKGLEAAAKSLKFELANALKLQTMGLLAIPLGAATFGYFEDGVGGAMRFGIMGLIAMGVLIVLIYRAGIVTSALAMLWTIACFALTAGLSLGVMFGIGFVLNQTKMQMPWKPRPVVAKVDPEAEQKKKEEEARQQKVEDDQRLAVAAEAEAARRRAEEEAKKAPVEPVKPAVTWTPVVDPAPPIRWPADVKNQLIDVKPPITMARSSAGSPFVAFVDSVALHVYDVRNAKRTGFLKDQKPPLIGSLLSPDGTLLVVDRRAKGNPQVSGGTPEFEVWSMTEARLSRKLSLDQRRQVPAMLGFDKDNRLVTATEWEGKALVQVWDLRSASPVKELQGPRPLANAQTVALSAGGRYIATVAENRVNIFDLNSGELVCDREMPRRDVRVRALSFSADGSQLAIIAHENNKNVLIVLDTTTGDVTLDTELGGGDRPDLTAQKIAWVPRGGGMLVENDWVDTATGKIVALLSPQTAGQSVGTPKLMFGDAQVLVEFQPAGNAQRLIYKGVSLNKQEIAAALASRRTKSPDSAGESDDKPIEIPSTADAKELTRQAVGHLSNNRTREAIAFAQAAVDKLPKTTKVESDEQAIALHVLGAAHMAAGDSQKARDPIERAYNYTKTSRSLILNRAKLDIEAGNFALRAVRDLDKLLATNLEEETLNVFGLAVTKLAPPLVTPAQVKQFNDKLDAYNKKLEAAKPGMRRWGSTWISESEYATTAAPPELIEERTKGEERVKIAAAEVERARKAFADAKKQALYDERKKDIPRDATRKNQPMYLSKAEDALAAAQKEAEASKLDLDAINARFPKPPYEESVAPTLPEMELVAKN